MNAGVYIMNVICFHDPAAENGFLSNLYTVSFEIGGRVFSSVEKYMMYEKANAFGDEETAGKILSTDDPAETKALGRQVRNYDDRLWNGIRQIVVWRGLQAKFGQHPELAAKLAATGNALLAECDGPKNVIWGCGLDMGDPRSSTPGEWPGLNMLGYTLMELRRDLEQSVPQE